MSKTRKAAAQTRLGVRLCSSLEVLHMTNRNAALRVIGMLVPQADLVAFAEELNSVGAGALARDVLNALVRTRRRAA